MRAKLGILLLLISYNLNAQQNITYIKGKVFEQNNGVKSPLIGANVYWVNSTVGTTTDQNGDFKLSRLSSNNKMVVSFIGYKTDTINVKDLDYIPVELCNSINLNEVVVTYKRKTTEVNLLEPINSKIISENELLKAACCNLSESFETNPSVDVSFTDAITGTKQIQMLGLAGPYTQITRENMPSIRGFSSIYGLTFIPGTWIESIHLNKGTGSVVNGYESIAGQIDVNLRNPESAKPVYLNLFANGDGRIEFNSNLKFDVGEKLGSVLLLSVSDNSFKRDHNHDNFIDQPIGRQYNFLNRWEVKNNKGIHFQLGFKGSLSDKTGGEINFDPKNDLLSNSIWGMKMSSEQYEGWMKLGKVNLNKSWQSVGLQLSASSYNQNSVFGLNKYDSKQNSFYANLLFQSIILNTNHKFKTGLSFQYDDYNELFNTNGYNWTEKVPGAFFEYTYNYLDKFIAVAGIRSDWHNIYGIFLTPRLHIRYLVTEKTSLRLSAGRGQRTANIISENTGLLASSRQFEIISGNVQYPYGLNPEMAWNYGLNLTHKFTIDYRDGSFSLDLYRTDFKNQIVIDLDQNPQQVNFYNLQGKSYSNSVQVQLDYELIKRLDMRLAYRWYDVETTYHGELKDKPFVSKNRAFLNLAYETKKHWKFDYTFNWQGRKRIPDMSANPVEFQLPEYSPSFFLMNAQISKSWQQKYEVYAGVENILNYTQKDPILSYDQPFSPYFDSSLIWGPIMGTNFYFGLRFKVL